MVFTSEIFLFYFLPLAIGVYFLLIKAPNSVRMGWLTLMSYVFYGWWRVDFIFLMMTSTIIDYICGLKVGKEKSRRPKLWLLFSITTNLGLLGYFKYANFIVANYNEFLVPNFGATEISNWERLVLPVGISFYTFQSMSYTIDIYRGHAKPVRNILDFSAYVALFPQLVAGPIVRYGAIFEQIVKRTHTLQKFGTGCRLFMMGFAKKMIIADGVGVIADEVFARGDAGFFQAWIGAFSYALQLYFDFSAYSDMAIGLGLIFGFSFPCNFNSPYKATSITDFWRRWHMTLSSWLRDYLYIPLGGNKLGSLRTYLNLMIVMLLGGLWHGAQWTFVIWGAIHGGFLAIERLCRGRVLGRLPERAKVIWTFLLVVCAWVVFRAPSMDAALAIFKGMFGLHGWGSVDDGYWVTQKIHTWQLIVGFVIVFAAKNSWQQTHERETRLWDLVVIIPCFLFALMMLMAAQHVPFLYYQF
ncbi:MAG: alginate O-acetyltransferase complex protein AlgI [Planctomycetota bacterium]|jgi:alginate O-acetyltransferase complex protein AlgI